METLKKCFNPKVLIGLAVIAAGIAVLAPNMFVAALPLLLLAACPGSMVLMVMMNKSPQGSANGATPHKGKEES